MRTNIGVISSTAVSVWAFFGAILIPLVPQLVIGRPASARPKQSKQQARQQWRRLNPEQASAVDAAVARVICEAPELAGNTLQLPCRECGRRAVPPQEFVDSPLIPFERAGLIPVGAAGFVITATCTACGAPLISRVVDDEYADYARTLGVIDGVPLEAEMRAWLDTL